MWQLLNRTIVLLLSGPHAVQERAKRMRIDLDPATKVVTVFEQAHDVVQERSYQQRRQKIGLS